VAGVPGGWKIPAVVLVAFAAGIGGYAVTRPGPSPALVTADKGLAQYPQAQYVLAEGDGKGLVRAYCSACHSLAPIITHGGFTAKDWGKEVTKMRTQYGAPIDDTTAKAITEYLQKHYTVKAPPAEGSINPPYSTPRAGG
jgi:cytochrome c5